MNMESVANRQHYLHATPGIIFFVQRFLLLQVLVCEKSTPTLKKKKIKKINNDREKHVVYVYFSVFLLVLSFPSKFTFITQTGTVLQQVLFSYFYVVYDVPRNISPSVFLGWFIILYLWVYICFQSIIVLIFLRGGY